MRRAMIASLVFAAACSSAQALDYTWLGTAPAQVWPQTTQYWHQAQYWDNGSGASNNYPNAVSANVYAHKSTLKPVVANTPVLTMGSLIVDNSASLQLVYTSGIKMYVTDNAGGTGDVYIRDCGAYGTTPNRAKLYIEGNVKLVNISSNNQNVEFILSGANKGYKAGAYGAGYIIVDGGSIFDNNSGNTVTTLRHYQISLVNGGQLVGGNWETRKLFVEGPNSLTGNTDIRFLLTGGDNGPVWVVPSTRYPRDLTFGSIYASSAVKTPYRWKFGSTGDVSVGRDLWIGDYRGGSSGVKHEYILDTVDNATGESVDLAINRGLLVRYPGPSTVTTALLRLHNSVVHVGDCVTIGYVTNVARGASQSYANGSIDLDNATLYVGGNWMVGRSSARLTTEYLYQNWNAGTSTVIFDGNGTVRTQTLYPDNMPLHNMVVRTAGTVQLSTYARDLLYLTGDLHIDCGTFNDQDRGITFNGDCHTLYVGPSATLTGGSFDNVILRPDSVLTLLSDITSDNLDLQSGSKLYLNGFTLISEGSTFISDQVSADGVPYTAFGSNGTIFGTQAIPEPATLLLIGTGALGALGYVRRRRMA